jgi:hypothetical protein
VPPASVPPASVPPASVPPAAVPPASVPPASVPPASVPPAAVPPASVPPASVPPASVPPAAVTPASVSRSPCSRGESCESAIRVLGAGPTEHGPFNDGQIRNVRRVRVHVSTGYSREEGNRRASRVCSRRKREKQTRLGRSILPLNAETARKAPLQVGSTRLLHRSRRLTARRVGGGWWVVRTARTPRRS